MNVIELRNYLLRPGKRDEFIQYFKEHFVDSQQQMGAYVPALFRIKNEEQRFFWIRGFDNMEERSRFLPSFYGGEIWKKYGPAANEMMLEWHNVHLVKPLAGNIDAFSPNNGFFVIDYYKTRNTKRDHLVDFLCKEHIPFLMEQNIQPISLWVSEMRENDFPRLPVYQDKDLLVVISRFDNEEAYNSFFRQQFDSAIDSLVESKTSISLYPVSL